jgi:hypothetical protein
MVVRQLPCFLYRLWSWSLCRFFPSPYWNSLALVKGIDNLAFCSMTLRLGHNCCTIFLLLDTHGLHTGNKMIIMETTFKKKEGTLQTSSVTTHLLKKVSTLQLHPTHRYIIGKNSCCYSFFPRSAIWTQLIRSSHLASNTAVLNMIWDQIQLCTSTFVLNPTLQSGLKSW